MPWTPKGKWNIRFKLFGFYGISVKGGRSNVGLGFGLPVVAAWWQLYFSPKMGNANVDTRGGSISAKLMRTLPHNLQGAFNGVEKILQ
jgi:hypothetical protein